MHCINTSRSETCPCLRFGLLAAVLLFGAGCGASPPPPPSPNFTMVQLTPNGELTPLLKAEAAKAKELGRKPFVEFYADWCTACYHVRQSLNDPLMIDAFAGTYIIRLNLDVWRERLPAAGFSVQSIPVYFEINDEGRPTGRQIDGSDFGGQPSKMAPILRKFFDSQ